MHVEKYKVGEIKEILEGIYNDKETRRTVVPIFQSVPGLGKTSIIKEFMVEKGVYHPEKIFLLSSMMPFEVSGTAVPSHGREVMTYYDFDRLLRLKAGDILFLDEVPNANPLTLNAFLTFLDSRLMASGKELPDIMIVAAGNPNGMPVFTPQVKRRFLWYDIVFDDTSFKTFLNKKYGMPKSIGAKLSGLVRNEDYTGFNFNSSADIDKAIGMIIKGIKTPYTKALKPILEELVENTYGETVMLGTETWEVNEKKKWLDVMKLIYKENGTIN